MKTEYTQDEKLEFAYWWLKNPTNAYQAALIVTNGKEQSALEMATILCASREVQDLRKQLIEQLGEEEFLPSKLEMFHKLWERLDGSVNEDFVKLMNLGCKLRGFIDQPAGININNNIALTNNKVMQIPLMVNGSNNPVSLDEWENVAMTQQQGLIEQ